jgi:hypothetical protein
MSVAVDWPARAAGAPHSLRHCAQGCETFRRSGKAPEYLAEIAAKIDSLLLR